MNSLPTRFIILMLFVLQGFAPLVHAHARINNTVSGVHINGFTSDKLDFAITVIKNNDHNPTIELGDAIQKKQSLDDNFDLSLLYLDTQPSFTCSILIKHTLAGSIPLLYPSNTPFLSTSAPRAPPYYT